MSQNSLSHLVVVCLVMLNFPAVAQNVSGKAIVSESENKEKMQPQALSEQIEDLSRKVLELQIKINNQGVDPVAMKANGDEKRLKMSMGSQGSPPAVLPQSVAIAGGDSSSGSANMMTGMMTMMNSMMGSMGGSNSANPPMGQANGMGPNSGLSVLPGFPGVSHLYHIGSTNFFLDHPQHISLSVEQQNLLSGIRMKALMERSDFKRRIQEFEEQLWLLTASDQPSFSNIEAKIRESEKLQGDLRLSLIKYVGEAAKNLSDEQRNALLGQVVPPVQPSPIGNNTSGQMGGM